MPTARTASALILFKSVSSSTISSVSDTTDVVTLPPVNGKDTAEASEPLPVLCSVKSVVTTDDGDIDSEKSSVSTPLFIFRPTLSSSPSTSSETSSSMAKSPKALKALKWGRCARTDKGVHANGNAVHCCLFNF